MFLMTTSQEEIYRLEKGIESDQKLKVGGGVIKRLPPTVTTAMIKFLQNLKCH